VRVDDGGDGVRGVVFAVSWKPLTNSKPSAITIATPSRMKGRIVVGPPPVAETSE
jgi:hypothetical protein